MPGMGTIINTLAILAGGFLGALFGRYLHDSAQNTLTKVCGVSTLFIGICGALEKMLKVEGMTLAGNGTMLVVICLALGTLVGEICNIEAAFERFGDWLKKKTGNTKDGGFTDAFVCRLIK